ncbi:MAG: hypothetical protein ACO3SY_06685 [Flavobacteriaceae bacterium]|jgi:cytochrome bd-type quinol oxidase subunit 1
MFSSGQLVFAALFFIGFTLIIIFSYKKDKQKQKAYFKGSYKILIGFLIAFSLLLCIKLLTQK